MRCRKRVAGRAQPGGEVPDVRVPAEGLRAGLTLDLSVGEQRAHQLFMAAEVAQFRRVIEREAKWFQRVVKTHEPHGARQVADGTQDRQGVGGRAEADVPDDKLTRMRRKPLAQPELPHVERLRLRHRADDGMKGFRLRQRADAADSVGERDKNVVRRRHARTVTTASAGGNGESRPRGSGSRRASTKACSASTGGEEWTQ